MAASGGHDHEPSNRWATSDHDPPAGEGPFTSEPGFELHAVWEPDGRGIVYSEASGCVLPHVVRRALASATSGNLMPPGPFQFAGSFTSDSSTLFYKRISGTTKDDVLRHDMKTGASAPVLVTAAREDDPQVSPDGQWLAFTSDASGSGEVYLVIRQRLT
jgi:tricorn protease-like protein